MTHAHTDLDGLLKRLHLANARRVWRDLTLRAEQEGWSCRDFLPLLVVEEEIAHPSTDATRSRLAVGALSLSQDDR